MLLILIIFILIVIGLTWFLLSRDRGSKEPVGALWAAALFGLPALIAAAFLEAKFLPVDAAVANHAIGSAFYGFLGVGFVEEAAKFIPLAFFIWKKRYFNEHTDGIIYFALCGLTFGLVENIGYTIGFGSKVGLTRIILIPFFHAATTGSIGYYLAKAKVEKKAWTTVLFPFIVVALMHGVYDFGLSSGVMGFVLLSLALTLLLSIGLFLFYMRANELDRAMGLSAVGNNKFCRACGRPNPHHMLYCEYCGKQA